MGSRVPCTGYQGISILARDLLASLHKKKRNVLLLTGGEHGIVLYVTVWIKLIFDRNRICTKVFQRHVAAYREAALKGPSCFQIRTSAYLIWVQRIYLWRKRNACSTRVFTCSDIRTEYFKFFKLKNAYLREEIYLSKNIFTLFNFYCLTFIT